MKEIKKVIIRVPGIQGPQGPAGRGVPDIKDKKGFLRTDGKHLVWDDRVFGETFQFNQNIPSSKWEIHHSMNKFPSVDVVDSAGSKVICDVTYIDRDNCILEMSAPFSGIAYLN